MHFKNRESNLFDYLISWSFRYIPDSMPIAIMITVLVFVTTLLATNSGPMQVLDYWYEGFWSLLTFTIQVSLLLLTGYLVADSKPVKLFLVKLCRIPKTPRQAAVLYFSVITLIMYVQFAMGLAAAIVLGRELVVAQKKMQQKLPYSAFVATGFIGFMLASSPTAPAPLMVATPGHFLVEMIGVIPIAKTAFDPYLLGMNVFLYISFIFFIYFMFPKKNITEVNEETLKLFTAQEEENLDISSLTPAQRMDHSSLFMSLVGLGGLFVIFKLIYTKGFGAIDFNNINFTFLILAVLLHRTPHAFIKSSKKATESIYGVLTQYPLYAGMFGMIKFSGLGSVMAGWFIAISTAETFPFIVMVYSSILNMVVPSGGSKFLIEAPYLIPAAKELGANINYTINAYTTGSLLTDVIQPFWAIPILSAFRLSFRAIFPYCLLAVVYGFVVMSITYLIFMH